MRFMTSTISKRMTDKSVNIDMFFHNHFSSLRCFCRGPESSSILCGGLSLVWWWRIKAVCTSITERRLIRTLKNAQENAHVFRRTTAKRNRCSAEEAIWYIGALAVVSWSGPGEVDRGVPPVNVMAITKAEMIPSVWALDWVASNAEMLTKREATSCSSCSQ